MQDTGYGIQDTGYRIRDTGYGIRDTGYGIRDTGYRIQDTGYRIQDTGYRIRDTGYRIRDTGYRIQDTGYRIRDTGYGIQDTGYRIRDTGCRMQDLRNTRFLIFAVAFLLLTHLCAQKLNLHRVGGKKTPDPGKVFWSNGEEWTGKINITRGRKLQINTDDGMKKVPIEKIRIIKFYPVKQVMEQKWMFPEAGKTQKEKYGDPYPVQHLEAEIRLKNGEKMTGHMFASVLYMRPPKGKKKRILLMSKQRGKEKQTFADLVYPEQIIMAPKTEKKENTQLLELPKGFVPEEYEVAALGIPDLYEVQVTQNPDVLFVNGELSAGIFTAAKKDNKITVFWPGENDKKLFTRVQKSINDMSDFFDQRELKAVYWPNKGNLIFSLTLMIRKGKTSLGAEKSNPWRLIIQRWKYDKNDGKLLLSGKGWLFRGIDKRGAAGPEVVVSKEKVKLTEFE